MDIPARLEGGPFDGADTFILDVTTPPRNIYAWKCSSCNNIHAVQAIPLAPDVAPDNDPSPYRFDRVDEMGAIYRFGDPTHDDDEEETDESEPFRTLTPVEDGELVPA